VLDRWHLLTNLGEVLQKILAHQGDVLRQAARDAGAPGPSSPPAVLTPPRLLEHALVSLPAANPQP
jgi:hypothetical protein